jgi:arylsulfatase A-like enzyme
MRRAAEWLRETAGKHDRFFLFVDEFDPHEPFDTPEPYASMYDDSWEGPHLIWPPYMRGAVEKGVLSAEDARQIRAQYGAKLTMIDAWFGRMLDAMDSAGLWESTVFIVTTDHGHYLGEKDVWGKPQVPVYEPMGHIPLLVAWPGVEGGVSRDALTTSVDVNATIRDIFAIEARQRTHGASFAPVVTGDAASTREWAVAGVWGREVHLIDAEGMKYARAPEGDNAPLSMWSNRWSTMPTLREIELPRPDERAVLDRMPGSTVPVIRQPFDVSDNVPFWALGRFSGNHLYALGDDPAEDRNLAGTPVEKVAADAMGDVLRELDAPDDQLVRLGLS